MGTRIRYENIPIVDAARRCGIVLDERTLSRSEVKAKCPFCGDKPGKYHLFLSTEKNVFKCFFCGETGNSVSLYARLQSPPISFGEAARALLEKTNVYPFPGTPEPQASAEKEPKPIDQRHEVYYAMLRHLALSEKHKANLSERGLSDERIRRNMYRSLPESESAKRLLASILSSFYDLDGIPGFYQNNRSEWAIAGNPGLLIPYRDKLGRIQGLQIRLDDEGSSERKYRWLSSRNMKNGAKSGSSIHITGNINAKTAYLTEGGLKGDVASFLDDDALFICVAGVNAIGDLKEVVKSLDVDEIVIAWDMDKLTNWRVRNALNNIAKVISAMRGVKLRTENWNASCKGIDDYYKARKGNDFMEIQRNSITQYLYELWKKEYPKQDAGFIYACEWEENVLPLSELQIDMPKGHLDQKKARHYFEQVKSGVVFPPVVCVNGCVIDGFHRCWAYEQAGIESVEVYQNVPWKIAQAA